MNFFQKVFKKEMYKYNMLERVRINIEKTIQNDKDITINEIGENENYIFYKYKEERSSFSHILRSSKENPKKVVYFGDAESFICIYHGHIFMVHGGLCEWGRQDFVIEIDGETGIIHRHKWLGTNAFTVFAMGWGRVYNQDEIKNMYIENDRLIIEASRRKGTEIKKTTQNNYPMNYKLYVDFIDNEFVPSYSFRLDKLTPNGDVEINL